MIRKIRILLEYNTYCLWLYDENDEIIDNDNPPEWSNDRELTAAFDAVSELYNTFFIDNDEEFTYIGSPDAAISSKLKELFATASDILMKKNKGKYVIQNNVDLTNL